MVYQDGESRGGVNANDLTDGNELILRTYREVLTHI